MPRPKSLANVVPPFTAKTPGPKMIGRTAQHNDYLDSIAPAPSWMKQLQAEAKRKGLDKLKMSDINRIVAEVRADHREKAR